MSNDEKYEFKQVAVRLCLKDAPPYLSDEPVNNSDKAVKLMTEILKDMDREYFCVINLDAALHPLNYSIVSIGSIKEAPVSLGNVFKSAILSNAVAIIAIHNHPSGNLKPSNNDLEVTERLVEAGALLDIQCLDHIIIGNGSSLSIKSAYPQLFKAKNRSPGVADCNVEYNMNSPRVIAI